MNAFKVISISILVLAVLSLKDIRAQQVKQARFDKWIFPFQGTLDFSNGNPTPTYSKTGKMNSKETTAVQCDDEGNLLFYTDGIYIFNGDHDTMPNCEIWSSSGAAQGVLITPFVNNPDKYYIFQVDGETAEEIGINLGPLGPLGKFDGLYYSIVDMTLNNGKGGIEEQNISLINNTAEALIAVMHDNGKDYWIIVRENDQNRYHAFLVTENGICSDNAVVSTIGTIGTNFNGLSQMSASFDNQQIATIEYNYPPQLFDFDNCTGQLSNAVAISNTNEVGYYDIIFSPNDSLIYVTKNQSPDTEVKLYQYQRFATDIPSTEVQFGVGYNGFFHGMRPYGDTVYIAATAMYYHILSNPNNYGDPGLEIEYYANPTMNIMLGTFPHYFDYKYNPNINLTLISDTILCSTDTISIGNNVSCGSDYTYSWSPILGLDNPNINNPTLDPNALPANQTFTYTVTANSGCGMYIDSINIKNECGSTFYVPSAFSPNGDQINDTFYPLYNALDITYYNLSIYDRWGKLVFTADSPDTIWDGKLNGNVLPLGIYYYTIQFNLTTTINTRTYVGKLEIVG